VRYVAPRTLDSAQALALAHKTGHTVVVSSLTTPTSQTTATPDGKFSLSESLLPVRKFHAGRWVALNPSLQVSGHRVLPAVTTDGVSLSAGGASPFVEMSAGGRTFNLSWPSQLPTPTVSGGTATYANVMPGVDLVVTVSPQGSFASTLVVHNAAAAADPGLSRIILQASAPGMTLQNDGGAVAAMVDGHGPGTSAAFGVSEPVIWDSTAPPAGAQLTQAEGTTVSSPSGVPAYSTASEPGAYAHVTQVPLAISGSSLTLAVPQAALTGSGVRYPLYIDPTSASAPVQNSSDWTEVESGYPNDDGLQDGSWNSTQPLQIGYCDPNHMSGCNSIKVTRSMFQMPVPTSIANAKNITVDSADLYLNDIWVATCSAEPMQLWGTNPISSSTTWNNMSYNSDFEGEKFAGYGNSSSCAAYSKDVVFGTDSGTKKGVTITNGTAGGIATLIQGDIRKGQDNQTFGIRAADESTTDGSAYLQWRQFDSGGAHPGNGVNISLDITYHNPPNAPSPATSPGGGCSTSGSDPAQIGNDDVTFDANKVSDDYSNAGLSTKLQVYYDSGTDPLEDTVTFPGTSGNLSTTITRQTIQGWQGTGLHEFYYLETTTNPFSQSTSSSKCYFDYNTAGPSAPTVTGMSTSVNPGQQVANVTFAAPSGCGSACPTSYKYQVGTTAPVTVSTNSGNNWTGTVAIGSQLGPLTFSVTGISSVGNPGEAATLELSSTMPAGTFVPDGYFSNGSYPDVLRTGTGTDASLYLSPGSGNGALRAPLDVGSLGDGIDAPPLGASDWNGSTVLHGNFCGQGVQDVMPYYPSGTHAGNGIVLCGFGSSGTLDWGSGYWDTGETYNVTGDAPGAPGAWSDDSFDDNDNPVSLVAAGDASQNDTGLSDIIGVLGSSTSYELNLYTATAPGAYVYDETLESAMTPAPDGTTDWQNYSLATAQLSDSANPHGDPADTALLALDRVTGALYESVNSGCPANCAGGTVIGMPGTWTQITVPWGSSPPALVQADVNSGSGGQGAGSLEVWTVSGSTATAYTISGTTMTKEGSGSPIAEPSNDWPLNDGSPTVGGTSTTATDVVSGNKASLTGTYSWPGDDYFGTTLHFGGNAYATPPTDIIPSADRTITLTMWFKATSADGVLFSFSASPLSSGNTTTQGFCPVLYVGNDGHLHGAFSIPAANAISSVNQVTDGQWHYVQLTEVPSGSSETVSLSIDGVQQGTATQNANGQAANVNFGAGYNGGNWPDEKYGGGTATLDYFNGQMADVTLTYSS
jgi:hypothetical protein